MARTQDAIEHIKPCLFLNEENMPYKLSEKDMQSKKRIEAAFAYALEHPQDPDSYIVKHLNKVFKIEKSQAYWDINVAKTLLGNIKNAGKEWHRHVVIQSCLDALKMARGKKNPIAMVMAADKIGKYTNCDKEDAEAIPWDKVIGFDMEFTSDPKVLKIKQNKDIDSLRKQLMKEFMSDAEIVE
jgi:hypothetical protein